jgi:hypothetical protein
MCIYISPEVILANVLSYKEKVSLEELMEYGIQLKKELPNVYINLNNCEMDVALLRYKDDFRFFQGHYYAKSKMKRNHFNARYNRKIINVLEKTAQSA